jgi:hypothetical protein
VTDSLPRSFRAELQSSEDKKILPSHLFKMAHMALNHQSRNLRQMVDCDDYAMLDLLPIPSNYESHDAMPLTVSSDIRRNQFKRRATANAPQAVSP